ncbi:MauE/DoxX family redox-associated membrane protein [Pontibacter sp. MBLB2868]|uniref:MauE/DoxX family redox-associated membrane protein n=1 Tax=Pontibacter sp. MBLB2868 TaxID=3451555 RepID=UPI003F7569EA
MKRKAAIDFIAALLLLLLLYTALSKLLHFQQFQGQLAMQPFPDWLGHILVWVIPLVELFTCFLLGIPKMRLIGLYVAAGLMAVFTGYVALVLLQAFGRVPCSCGGVLGSMGWKEHLFFNMFFLALPVIAILLHFKAKRLWPVGDGQRAQVRQKGGQF